MIEVSLFDQDGRDNEYVEFHGRDRREYILSKRYNRYLPDVFHIKIYIGIKHAASIEFRGTDCHELIMGILENANDYTLRELMRGAQHMLEKNAKQS